jgi:hypothetical protein
MKNLVFLTVFASQIIFMSNGLFCFGTIRSSLSSGGVEKNIRFPNYVSSDDVSNVNYYRSKSSVCTFKGSADVTSLRVGIDYQLADSSTVVVIRIDKKHSGDVYLNGGTIFLESDFCFAKTKSIIGPGTLMGNYYDFSFGNVSFSAPLTFQNNCIIKMHGDITLNDTWTFGPGSHEIDGCGNVLALGVAANIVVSGDCQLKLSNVTIQDVSGTKIRCDSVDGLLVLQNVLLHQNADYNFSQGAFRINGLCEFFGGFQFRYKSSKISQINKYSSLILHQGFTFSYEPSISSKSCFSFEDSSSILYLRRSTLYAALPGLILKKGGLVVEGVSYLRSAMNFTCGQLISGGIEFGSGESEDDFLCRISPGSTLKLASGAFIFNSTNCSSCFNLSDSSACFEICPGTVFKLCKNLSIAGNDKVYRSVNSHVLIEDNASFDSGFSMIP